FYIIGMMNTADRSLALLDYALRRRFAFFEIQPAFENKTFNDSLPDTPRVSQVIKKIREINQEICGDLGTGFQIGHSYFTGLIENENPDKRIEEIIEYEIIPQLEEYWFDVEETAQNHAQSLRDCYE